MTNVKRKDCRLHIEEIYQREIGDPVPQSSLKIEGRLCRERRLTGFAKAEAVCERTQKTPSAGSQDVEFHYAPKRLTSNLTSPMTRSTI